MQAELDAINEKVDRLIELIEGRESKPMRLEEAAEYLDVSKGHLYKLTCRSEIPFYKPMGKRIYFRKKELDEWIYRRRSRTVEEVRNHV